MQRMREVIFDLPFRERWAGVTVREVEMKYTQEQQAEGSRPRRSATVIKG